MELTERFYDKNRPSGDAVEQYHIILRMLETDEELVRLNKAIIDIECRRERRIRRELKQKELKETKKEVDYIYREYQKMVKQLNREIGQMNKSLYNMTNSLKIKYGIKI